MANNDKKIRRRTPLTPEQRADAARLLAAWQAWRDTRKAQRLPYSQEWIGSQFREPVGQAAVHQYLQGMIALNVSALAEFSRILGVSASDISPTLGRTISTYATVVAESSELIARQLEAQASGGMTSGASFVTTPVPGYVLTWDEVEKMIREDLTHRLPEVFTFEVKDDALVGYARDGDTVTLNRALKDAPRAGDGVLVHSRGPGAQFIALRIYTPRGDGTWTAKASNPNYEVLHSDNDQLSIIAVVTGVPSCRWSHR